MPENPIIVGIAGASCSGKTTLAKHLAKRLPGTSVVLPLDAYYRDQSQLPLPTRSRVNFDTPEALEFELLLDHVTRLARGAPVNRPVYDFTSHTRNPRSVRVAPGDYLLVEGLFALYWPALLARYALALFIDTPDDTCLQRRLARDTTQRGRTAASVRHQFRAQTRPMFQRYGQPTRGAAHLVLDGSVALRINVSLVLRELDARVPPPHSGRT